MTTIINTHDMNSVMGIGENIIFIYEGRKEWQGVSAEIMGSTNKRLTDFIFASDLLKEMRQAVRNSSISEVRGHGGTISEVRGYGGTGVRE